MLQSAHGVREAPFAPLQADLSPVFGDFQNTTFMRFELSEFCSYCALPEFLYFFFFKSLFIMIFSNLNKPMVRLMWPGPSQTHPLWVNQAEGKAVECFIFL